jgi:hypothetical protein
LVDSVIKKAVESDKTEDGKPLRPATDPPSMSSEFVVPEAATKKPRRALGLAVGLSNLAAGGSVMVESVKSVWGEGAQK